MGFADLSGIDTSCFDDMNYGIAFGIKLKPEIIAGIHNGPTRDYYDEYNRVNEALDHLVLLCTEYIKDHGYKAIGQTTTYVTEDNNLTTPLPHKTVATRAGLGWIGKNALLVTPQYGSAIRISSVITDMPLTADIPVDESKCGCCTCCASACPASAIKGTLWNKELKREELIDPFRCKKIARGLAKEKIGVEITLCGKCIEVCPYTKKYLKSYK